MTEIWYVAFKKPNGETVLGSVELSFEEAAESALFLNDKSPGSVGGIAMVKNEVNGGFRIEEFITLAAIERQDVLQ